MLLIEPKYLAWWYSEAITFFELFSFHHILISGTMATREYEQELAHVLVIELLA
jgi:hypothetical protein